MKRGMYDVVVAGGGLAGVCAAISAARLGCRTALVQDRPVLGGNSSSEIRVPVGGCGDFNAWGKETGIIEEIITESKVRQSRQMTGVTNSLWDLTLYDIVRQEKNIDLFLNTSCRKAVMMGKNKIKGAVCVQL
jgi:flavin-dependent dehydrogenase